MRYDGSSAELDRTLVALADPIRRHILKRLAAGSSRVTDLASAYPISLNSVSKHIRLLERAKLVEREVVGREHILTFRPEPLSAVQAWIRAQESFWSARLQAMDEILAAEDEGQAQRAAREKRQKTRTKKGR